MINFTVGPVQSNETVCRIGGEQVPYFRTDEFSEIMFENNRLLKKISNAPNDARVAFLTASGTAAMESAIINVFDETDKLLIVNGGAFGQRFVDICNSYRIPYEALNLGFGETLTKEHLEKYENKSFSGFLVNLLETSTGILYDINIISNFCERNKCVLVVDAISAFIAEAIDFTGSKIDVLITGSQKALACAPGISILIVSNRIAVRVMKNSPKCFYLDLKKVFVNAERGQTPFTPAVGIILQINARLREIAEIGVDKERERIHSLAKDFREQIKHLPFKIVSGSISNAVTPLQPEINMTAYDVFIKLKEDYSIWVCPNGGVLKDKVFRVGHIGALTLEDNKALIDALRDISICTSKTH